VDTSLGDKHELPSLACQPEIVDDGSSSSAPAAALHHPNRDALWAILLPRSLPSPIPGAAVQNRPTPMRILFLGLELFVSEPQTAQNAWMSASFLGPICSLTVYCFHPLVYSDAQIGQSFSDGHRVYGWIDLMAPKSEFLEALPVGRYLASLTLLYFTMEIVIKPL
jgi:hypothetical protein